MGSAIPLPLAGARYRRAVFSIQHGARKAIWVNTGFDMEGRRFQYVYFIPDLLVTTIDVNFEPVDSGNTKVRVVYSRTALDPAVNEHVREFGEEDSPSGKHWEDAINNYLKDKNTR